jgi:hypothetical protein
LCAVSATGKEIRVRASREAPEWYFFKAGSHAAEKTGPFSWERLRLQAQEGALEPADVVWDPGTGWRTAAQIPGLFPAVASPGVAGTYPDTPPPGPSAITRGRSWLPWLAALVALVIVGGGLGTYFGFLRDSDKATASYQTTTTVAATTTTIPVTTAQSTATTVTETTTVSEPRALNLDESDNGREVALHVGDRVRIELKPNVNHRVRSVAWDFEPIVVQERDSGSEKAGDRVVGCWLELEAAVAGLVTVRAQYEYKFGTVKTTWVVYFRVAD